MKTMTLDEVKRLPPLTAEEIAEVRNFRNTDFEDCPKQSKEDFAQFRPWYELHQGSRTSAKAEIHLRVDSDILAWFKNQGKDYQAKINAVLREYVSEKA